MVDRITLLEAALESLSEGVVLADHEGRISLWNHAAEIITGYESHKMAGKSVGEVLPALIQGSARRWIRQTNSEPLSPHGSLVRLRNRAGYEVALMAHSFVLRDSQGMPIGSGVVFHSTEGAVSLPHGEVGEDSNLMESQAEIEDRLATMHENSLRTDMPLGVLWLTVDQAGGLRRTHGSRAVEAMLERMVRTLAGGLSPGEEIARWGDDEFLVLSHERNTTALAAHAQTLAGMARTTDFRWWGDRISLTVSIGAAQAERGQELKQLLERAQAAMRDSIHAGGNHVTAAQGGTTCSPS
jgi:PAS domain S-box-containing protein/diguanylate cyclase (GGDEF)-like protein